MILKASQRAGGRQLAAHLLRADENEHVEVHEIRGFMADDLNGAFQEAYAASKATRAKQFLFSLSLNPPPKERVRTEVFEAAIDQIEKRLGLTGQPRTVVFHEKDGRRHGHAVWSRIDSAHGRAINLPHYKLKLREIARELYLEHGWQMPRGFVSSKERNPFSFTRNEWQQAKRTGHDAEALKRMFRECWAISDSGKAVAQALKARRYTLARGDRRGHVAVDYRGEVYVIAKYAGVRTRQVRDRLGDPAQLPSVDEASREIGLRMSAMLRGHIEQAEKANRLRSAALKFQYTQTIQRQRDERETLKRSHEARWNAESAARGTRLSKGFRGIWDRLTGKNAETKRQNEREALLGLQRDRREMDSLIFRHLDERGRLQQRIREERKSAALDVQRLHQDIARFMEVRSGSPTKLREHFRQATGQREDFRPGRDRSRDRDFEPEI